jgi:hypothetical protein
VSNHSIQFRAAMGNVPRIGLVSSVVFAASSNPALFSSSNASALSLTTSDGRDDHVKQCNGIGRCDFSSAVCACPFGWEMDADLGSCGRVVTNTSQWAGLARCPGVVSLLAESRLKGREDMSSRQNYPTRMYVSVNPSERETMGGGNGNGNRTVSAIYRYPWTPSDQGVSLLDAARTLLVNLSSNSSAGPMVLDQATDRLFFLDRNPISPHIGVAYLDSEVANTSVWLELSALTSQALFALALDAHFDRRRLYWSVPGSLGAADGAIYWAALDAHPPVATSLVAAIGQVPGPPSLTSLLLSSLFLSCLLLGRPISSIPADWLCTT